MERTALLTLRGNRTRTEVAKSLGITRQMLGAIEAGKRNPSLALAKRIADYFGASVETLFFEPDSSGHNTKVNT